MATVRLTREEASRGGLPAVCLQCGQPATREVERTFSTDRVPPVPPPIIPDALAGCLMLPIWVVLALVKLVSWSSAVTMTVRMPVCARHARTWLRPGPVEASAITADAIELTSVAEAFAQAWARQRPPASTAAASVAAPAGEVVKVRCRQCRALNEETARFCSQCGQAL